MIGLNDIKRTFEEKINKYDERSMQPSMVSSLTTMLFNESVEETLLSIKTIDNVEVFS